MKIKLETKDLIIKKGEPKDWKDMYYNIWRHRESARYMLWDVTTSEEDAKRRMERTVAFEESHPYCWIVYEKASGQAIGFAGMEEIEDGVYEDMGVALGPDFVGKGYGKQIIHAFVEFVRDELGAKKMLLSYREGNVASQRLQEACGFAYSHSIEKTDPRNGQNYVLKYTVRNFSAERMWDKFLTLHSIEETNYEAWQFGDAPDELADLVLRGVKTGTSSAYAFYEIEKEPLPQTGEYSVILNSKDEAVCIIRTTKVYVVSFKEVGEEHAYKEGEGDRSLAYWRQVHEAFFTEEMRQEGLSFNKDMQVVCEEFEVVYKLGEYDD